MISFSIDLSDVVEVCDELQASVDSSVYKAMDAVIEKIADAAKSDHTYENRTGSLEASTRASEYGGTFSSDTLYGEVVADAESNEGTAYGSFVEQKGFLVLPAERAEADVDTILDDALSEAAREAGW